MGGFANLAMSLAFDLVAGNDITIGSALGAFAAGAVAGLGLGLMQHGQKVQRLAQLTAKQQRIGNMWLNTKPSTLLKNTGRAVGWGAAGGVVGGGVARFLKPRPAGADPGPIRQTQLPKGKHCEFQGRYDNCELTEDRCESDCECDYSCTGGAAYWCTDKNGADGEWVLIDSKKPPKDKTFDCEEAECEDPKFIKYY